MQPYPTFYPQMNNYGQMMPNPYMDRMAQLQQYQQNLQPAQIPGTYPQQPQGIIGRAKLYSFRRTGHCGRVFGPLIPG